MLAAGITLMVFFPAEEQGTTVWSALLLAIIAGTVVLRVVCVDAAAS